MSLLIRKCPFCKSKLVDLVWKQCSNLECNRGFECDSTGYYFYHCVNGETISVWYYFNSEELVVSPSALSELIVIKRKCPIKKLKETLVVVEKLMAMRAFS